MSDFRQLIGKRVLMTGGATNIGRESALLMARHGASVVIGDINIEGATETVAQIAKEGGTAFAVKTDVTREEDVSALVAQAVGLLGGIDIGFFNAGMQKSGTVDTFPVEDWDALFRVNPRHCFLMAKYATPHLRAAGGGSIVLMSSVAAVKGGPGMTAYSASKAAIAGFGRALAAELAISKIRVNVLCPGWVDTPFNQPAIDFMGGSSAQESIIAQIVPLGRQATPLEIAQTVLFLSSDMSSYTTGQIILVDGGIF
jgi:NAD(P)-dependent dehydrogenase (short-subunit alcohol dehydrogenase family)